MDHIPGALGVHGTSSRGGTLENNQVLVDWLVSLKGAWVIDVLDFRKRKVLKCKWDQINRNFALEKF